MNKAEHSTQEAPIVCLCGSTKYKDAFFAVAKRETLDGKIVLMPTIFSQVDGINLEQNEIDLLTRLHYQKIRMSTEVVAIMVNGVIGEATKTEAEYAQSIGKPVRYVEYRN